MKMKRCVRCGWVLPINQFHKDQTRVDGLYPYCKRCNYANARKHINEKREYYLQYQKDYKRKNPEKVKKLKSDWGKKNRKWHAKKALAWNQAHPDKVLDRRLKKYFNISIADYQNMNGKQGGLCAICGKRNINGRKLFVDHDHKTGEVRGLLCMSCNTGLGSFSDDTSIMMAAINYLKQPRAGMHETMIKEAIE